MDKEALDVLRKHTVTMTALAKALDRLSEEIKKMPLNLAVGSGSAPLVSGPRKPDKYDEANARIERLNGEQTNPDKLTFEQRLQRLEANKP